MFLAERCSLAGRGNQVSRLLHAQNAEVPGLHDIVGNMAHQLLQLDEAVVM
jgi:hypothetical protein